MAKELGVPQLKAYNNSQLVVRQVREEYKVNEPNKVKYLQKVRKIMARLLSFSIEQISRLENTRADLLSKLATSRILGFEKIS